MASSPATWNIDYAPPLDWPYFLAHWGGRTTEGVEVIDSERLTRSIEIDGDVGVLTISHDAKLPRLRVSVGTGLGKHQETITRRVRRMVDLDVDLKSVHDCLGADPHLGPMLAAKPGMRIPGAWSPFETLVRTIVGQQVAVKAATTIMGRIVGRLGKPLKSSDRPTLLFPTPLAIAEADLTGIGMPGKRVQTLQNVARAVHEGELTFPETKGDASEWRTALLAMPGIGPWTVEYFALRAMGDADAWPESDLVIRREVERLHPGLGPKERGQMDRWKPCRGYAAVHLWRHSTERPEAG